MINSGNTYKYLDEISGDFYNCKKLLTYNRPWNFVTGSRSIGKSTNIGAFCIIDYLKNGHKFIYTRRTKDETLLTCESFFTNPLFIVRDKTDLQIYSLTYEKGEYFIVREKDGEKEQCGAVVPLSLEQKYKSANFSEYCNLIFDEFICQDPTKYLGSRLTPEREYRAILSLYQTIDRGIDKPYRNETRFFFLGNTATIYNPLFLSIGISDYIEDKAKIIAPKGKLWILERIESVEALEEMQESFIYQLSDEEGKDYAFRNKGKDSNDYIKKPPEKSKKYLFTLIKDNVKYGVWTDLNYTNYYIGEYRDIGREEIALDTDSHHVSDLILITTWEDMPAMRNLFEAFKRNRLFFASGKVKNTFYKYFKLAP